MKKLLLAVCSVLMMGATAIAAGTTFTQGDFQYTTSDENTVTLSKFTGKATEVTVPETVTENGVTYTVTAIGERAFKWSDAVSITLPNTIVEFGKSAFDASDALTTINMPTSLKTIGDYAFSSTPITSMVMPESLKTIGNSAFFACKSLASITLNEGLEEIGPSAFYKAALTEVVLPESCTTLGKSAFMQCEKLAKVTIKGAITSLGDGTFYKCKALTDITIPNSVTSIGQECFLESGLTTVTLGDNVETIGTSAFAKTAITSIGVVGGNKNFKVTNGCLYDIKGRLLYAVPMKGVTSVIVAKGCIGINGGAFWGSEVQNVTIPDGLLAIDAFAFCQSALAKINLPSSITFIGEQGFASTKLTEITLPENMTLVQDGVLAGCTELKSVTIPSAVKLIYNHAFHNDVNLASVTCLGATAPEIDDVYETYDSPFYGVAKTTPLYIPKGAEASYKAAGWNSYLTITEGENSVLALESATPASGTTLGKYAEMKVVLTFGDDITIVNAAPAVYLREGSEISGAVIESDDKWVATKDGAKSVNIWSSDYDSMVQTFTPKQDTKYYLIVPAGVVKNAAGDLNERIVIEWNGPAAPKPLEVVSISPADGTVIETSYAEMKFLITFADDITIVDYGPDAELRKGNAETGTLIQPDLSWKATKESAKVLNLWAADYDSCVQTFKVEADETYYMTIPAGIVQNAAGDKNEQIVITLKGKTSGIEGVEADAECHAVAHFDHLGRAISPDAKGIHIVKMSNGTVKKVMVK